MRASQTIALAALFAGYVLGGIALFLGYYVPMVTEETEDTLRLSVPIRPQNERVALMNPTGPNSIEGAMFVNSHQYGALAANLSVRGKPIGRHWKYFPPEIWHPSAICGVSYDWIRGKCRWCAVDDVHHHRCLEGRFTVSVFRDDNKAYSLQTRGTLDLVGMRSLHRSPYGKAELDQVYFTCSRLNSSLPVGKPGRLTLDHLPGFSHAVAALPQQPLVKRPRNQTAVCTKAFYGTGINPHTIERFVVHYLETWKFDYIIMYELGTTVGTLLKDVIQQSTVLQRYARANKLVLIDFRQELQREYGAIAGDMVLLSSKNGQLVVSSDCINRAKSIFTQVEWVLLIDWDEILTVAPYRQVKPESFASFAAEKSAFLHSKGKHRYEVEVLDFERHRASENLICDDCGANIEPWNQTLAMDYALQHEAAQFLNKTQRTETLKKYALRISQDGLFPTAASYGVHDLGRCAYREDGGLRYSVSLQDVYLRHYKCLNKDNCDEHRTKLAVGWPLQFGANW
ncbi:hypothetical protein BASA81_010737 [Batrachochytrium salamandrivorans]|nr:hypothetical protein BASA81_010737 [Batrachochytrium salamandrivorans]